MLSLQEISDRLEIQDLFTAHSHAIDRRDWDALDRIFTPDAVIDYTAPTGWRIQERYEKKTHFHNVPDEPSPRDKP